MKLPPLATVALGIRALMLLAVSFLAPACGEPARSAAVPGQRMPAFTAKVEHGKDAAASSAAVVYMTLGVRCPATPLYTERVRELERAYMPKGVAFVYLYPNVTESSDEKAEFHAHGGYVGGMIDDRGAAIAKLLACRKTSEAFVVRRDGVIAYRGGIDDNLKAADVETKYLANALDELLAGKPVTTQSTQPFG